MAMSVWLVLVLLGIVLAVALGVIVGRRWPSGDPRQRSIFERIWAALTPDFAAFDTDRVTTQTMHLLVAAMLVFGCVAAAWAASAGVMRTAWLFATKPDGVADALSGPSCAPSGCPGWLFAGVLAWQLVRAIGGVLLICTAAGLAGALLGFIFGIPRPISAAAEPPAAAGGAATPPGVDQRAANKAWELSTNLTQISDWLTKVIVGASLVEAKNAFVEFQNITKTGANWLFSMRHGSPVLLAAAIIGGAIFGFLFAYLYTELIISRLIAAVDRGLGTNSAARQTISDMVLTQAIAPRIPRAGPPQTTVQPTTTEVQAALQFHAIRFEDLISRPNVTFTEVLSWSRAKAVLNDYRAAAQGYTYLLGTLLGPKPP